ncbi:MAG: exodeoxyribonuclease V subunit alpha [Colwellia sp.]
MAHHLANNVVNTLNQPIYRRFNQVKEAIQGIEAIDYFFAKEMSGALLTKIQTTDSDFDRQGNLYHLFLALSASLRAGHSCLSLPEIASQHWGRAFTTSPQENRDHAMEKTLSHVGFVFAPLKQLQVMLTALNIQPSDQELLVFDQDKLYLRRYFQFERDLAQAIKARLLQHCQYDNDTIAQCITRLFPDDTDQHEEPSAEQLTTSTEIDWQKVAVANAINKNFSVIAGGPGTGKTYTVTKLLAALVILEQQQTSALAKAQLDDSSETELDRSLSLNIALIAPTGKAAQRLSESIIDAITGFKGLIDDKVLSKIPTQAQTIHRLLGVLPNSPNFRHNEDNRLRYDVVLIDEVSMVDLPLMTRLFRALKDSAKVILLGDADQLPSVAAGSVLADIAPRPHNGFSVANKHYLMQVCQLSTIQMANNLSGTAQASPSVTREHNSLDYLCFLVKSRRFDGKGGIGLIANAVINGDVKSSWQLLNDAQAQDMCQLSLAQGELSHWLAPLVKKYYQPIEFCADIRDAFVLLSQFRVLCATRQGDYGVERINDEIKGYLGKGHSLYQPNQQALYHGQPIMINENDYRLGLYNGDIGIIWQVNDQEGNSHLMACFEATVESVAKISLNSEQNEQRNLQKIRQILPSRLPQFESVYAMTIHKTQGSEFSHVAMVLSAAQSDTKNKQQSGSKLLSRELLYTGITRAKKHLTICVNQNVWQQGVSGQVKRYSGLRLAE